MNGKKEAPPHSAEGLFWYPDILKSYAILMHEILIRSI